jgi:hypothetical protein
MDMGRTTARGWLVAVISIAGCYDSKELPPVDLPPECVDGDGVGWGQGDACAGQDCNYG